PIPPPASRPIYIAPGTISSATNAAPASEIQEKPSSNVDGGVINERYASSSLSCVLRSGAPTVTSGGAAGAALSDFFISGPSLTPGLLSKLRHSAARWPGPE